MSFLPDTDNFFKYILTVGVLMILFGLVYPLKQEQLLRNKLIDIQEQDSLIQIEVKYLELQAQELAIAKQNIQLQVDELKAIKEKLPPSEQVGYDDKILALIDKFNEKKAIGINAAKEAKIKDNKLLHEQLRYFEAEKQIHEYRVFKTAFWTLGLILAFAGLFFWIDSTYFEERVKSLQHEHLQPPYVSKYAVCYSYLQKTIVKYKIISSILAISIIALIIWMSL